MGICLVPQTEPEIIEETNIDRVNEPRGYARSRQVKGHSETSTLSSQPSIDEVRQQMHMLLEEAFSLASAGHAGQSRHPEAYGSTQHLPYSEVVTSAPGTMTRPRAGVQWVPTYRPEMYQYSLPRPVSQTFLRVPALIRSAPARVFWQGFQSGDFPDEPPWDLETNFAGLSHVLQPGSKPKPFNPVDTDTQETLMSDRNMF